MAITKINTVTYDVPLIVVVFLASHHQYYSCCPSFTRPTRPISSAVPCFLTSKVGKKRKLMLMPTAYYVYTTRSKPNRTVEKQHLQIIRATRALRFRTKVALYRRTTLTSIMTISGNPPISANLWAVKQKACKDCVIGEE